MSNDLVPFAFEGRQVRTVVIDLEPWWVGKDVCCVLGYTNPNKAMQDHCKGITKRYPLQTPGGEQQIRILNEPDVMRLIASCKLPAGRRFERWIFEEVLPTIRKTGAYLPEDMVPMNEVALRRLDSIERKVDQSAVTFKALLSENQHLSRENRLLRENERLRDAYEKKGTPLGRDERELIAGYARAGKSVQEIARIVRRSETTVRRFVEGLPGVAR